MQRNMKQYVRFSVIVYVCGLFSKGVGEKILGQETDEFDFDGLPGAQHEFKVEVGAGKEECFFQKVVAGGKMHISFEVIDGGDFKISAFLRNHLYQQDYIDAIFFQPDGMLMHEAKFGGVERRKRGPFNETAQCSSIWENLEAN